MAKRTESDEIAGRIAAILSNLGDERAPVAARASLFSRARLRAARGAEDPAGARRLEVAARRSAVRNSEAERARVPVVPEDPDRAVLHGRLVDRAGRGQRGLTIVVLDPRGQEAAHAETAETGYFQFVFPPPGKRASGGKASEAKGSSGDDEVEVHLEVKDAKGVRVAAFDDPVTLVRGVVLYLELPV